MDQGYAVVLYEAIHIVRQLGKAHQWCHMYDFIF